MQNDPETGGKNYPFLGLYILTYIFFLIFAQISPHVCVPPHICRGARTNVLHTHSVCYLARLRFGVPLGLYLGVFGLSSGWCAPDGDCCLLLCARILCVVMLSNCMKIANYTHHKCIFRTHQRPKAPETRIMLLACMKKAVKRARFALCGAL